jgi:hypothetical protein
LAAEQKGSSDEERCASAAEQDDRVTVGSLHRGGCGAGAVETLAAALAYCLDGHTHEEESA